MHLRVVTFVKFIVVCTVFWSVSIYGQESAEWATVKGQVFDFEGQPMANAKISIFPMEVGMSGMGPPARRRTRPVDTVSACPHTQEEHDFVQ